MQAKKQREFSMFMRPVKRSDVVTFTRELATLNKAGIPLIRCLSSIRDQMPKSKFRQVIGDVVENIERGDSFSEALRPHERTFTPLYVNMIRSGEAGGELDEVLRRLAALLEKEERLKKKVKSALVYPGFVLSFALIILGVLMVVVIPTFTKIFADLGGELPAATQFLINTSDFTRHYWYFILFGIIVIVQIVRMLLRYHAVRYAVDQVLLRVPIFGKLTRHVAISSFSRTLGTLLNSGVPIIAALQIVQETQTNLVYAGIVPGLIRHVKEGESLTPLLERTRLFPNLAVKLINVGEETGELSELLVQVADNYEEEVDLLVSALASLLEPILIIFMGLIVGFIVIAMFLPLFNLTKLV